MVDAWSKYQLRGLWGLWVEYFSDAPDGFDVGWQFEGSISVFSFKSRGLRSASSLPADPVFRWVSDGGFDLRLYSEKQVQSADLWQLLLNYEAKSLDDHPTFLPIFPVGGAFSAELNNLIITPPRTLLLSGQPGTGKSSTLQCLSLLHGLARLRPGAVMPLQGEQGAIYIVPEVALLEVEEQQNLLAQAESGASVWAATVYDTSMLKTRKILVAAFADFLDQQKILLQALAKRDASDLKQLAAFWSAFYGVEQSSASANLDYYKRRILGMATLSIESILEEGRGLRGVVAEFEKEAILKAHARVGRSQHKIARLLKVSRGSLQHKLRKYELESYATPDADSKDGA